MKIAENNNGHMYTVSTLTREIKSLLEERFSFLWITGEISNYAVPSSGHSYFSLKDATSVISCVMFKNQKRGLKFLPESGMKIIGLARISLYEPRGSYQLIFEHLEPEGAGSLQMAFEQLKKKLASQGLFDVAHKKPLPFLPAKINVITSGTGAAVRDILHVAGRRFPGCHLQIVPVNVQGETAETEISQAIQTVNALQNRSELIILARGGGSIEDLSAFNSEKVARAIFESKIPVITGIGHETDFTIADFVADLRAPTPSAAAELALPDKTALIQQINRLRSSLAQSMNQKMGFLNQKRDDLSLRLKSPARVVKDFKLRIQEFEARMNRTFQARVLYHKERVFWLQKILMGKIPLIKIRESRKQVDGLVIDLGSFLDKRLSVCKTRVREMDVKLGAFNPRSVLDRGYSIARILPGKKILMDAKDAAVDDQIELILSKGRLVTRVEEK
ncbi:MAG: exodeoxyribonuclease VII large subunit [Proteobacteria bacterium]|nr:exodeoxyribonuclease VII large subunit [Desulfobacula sp.]MBU3952158.1 exodeoxyribonuclease VII large subunit [Pseudomonadota bacterium]MBU4132145.1 exodeoxyribonuclease VII large subunit [Pseudomonadota bacterium]